MTWLYCHVNGIRGISGVTWNVRDRHVRGIVFAHARHGEQMVDFFPPNSTNLGDLREPTDRNLRPETKFDSYAVHNWDQRDPTAAADIKSQLDNVIISKDMFDPDRALPRQPNLTDEDVTVAFDDDLGFIRGLGADATLDYDADDGADSDDGSKPKRKKAAKQKDDGGKEKSSKPAPKTGRCKGEWERKGKGRGADG